MQLCVAVVWSYCRDSAQQVRDLKGEEHNVPALSLIMNVKMEMEPDLLKQFVQVRELDRLQY